MDSSQFIVSLSVFKGEGEVHSRDEVMDVVDVQPDGRVQFGIDGPKGQRLYLTLDVGELVSAVMVYAKPEA